MSKKIITDVLSEKMVNIEKCIDRLNEVYKDSWDALYNTKHKHHSSAKTLCHCYRRCKVLKSEISMADEKIINSKPRWVQHWLTKRAFIEGQFYECLGQALRAYSEIL